MTKELIASIIMAAGRGSRMKDFDGNKTLLPLIPGKSPYEGDNPILLHIIANLPAGPKALVVNHRKQQVQAATRHLDLAYCDQPKLNGTGGAILAATDFISAQPASRLIITMGDVPFVKPETYMRLVAELASNDLVVLGFQPEKKKQYGVLETAGDQVLRITEWKYWKDYPAEKRDALNICNSGIYAADKGVLADYLPVLASRPQIVQKEVNGKLTDIQEYFITDLIEYLVEDGRSVGFLVTEDEYETMGVDDPAALKKCQDLYSRSMGSRR